MFSLLGILLILAGDVLLIRCFFRERKQKLDCLSEMMTCLREVTGLMYEFKLPLEDALKRQAIQGKYSGWLWKYITDHPNQNIRVSLTEAIEQLPFPEQDAKNAITEYFKQLGKSPKEQTVEHYKSVATKLEQLYHTKRDEYQKSNRLSAGTVYAISLTAAILLW